MVATSDKRRYEMADGRIRAAQGHSTVVDLGLTASTPPAVLFHGTIERYLPAILSEGLRPMRRQYVHLSADRTTARAVGARRGRPIILDVSAAQMHENGHRFFVASNGVWLVDAVPAAYLRVPGSAASER